MLEILLRVQRLVYLPFWNLQPPKTVELGILLDSYMNLSFLHIGGGEINSQLIYVKEEVHMNTYKDRTDFWKKIYNEYYQPPKPLSSSSNSLSFGIILMIMPFLVNIF